MSQSFTYHISYGGGVGPDVWDAEMTLTAVDIADAIAQANGRIEESGGWIFMVSQEDYPMTTREKLEERTRTLERELAEAKAELKRWKTLAGKNAGALAFVEVERDAARTALSSAQAETQRIRDEWNAEHCDMQARLDRAQAENRELKAAINKRQPRIGAWEQQCVLCGAKTDCGEIPHQSDCPFARAALDAGMKGEGK